MWGRRQLAVTDQSDGALVTPELYAAAATLLRALAPCAEPARSAPARAERSVLSYLRLLQFGSAQQQRDSALALSRWIKDECPVLDARPTGQFLSVLHHLARQIGQEGTNSTADVSLSALLCLLDAVATLDPSKVRHTGMDTFALGLLAHPGATSPLLCAAVQIVAAASSPDTAGSWLAPHVRGLLKVLEPVAAPCGAVANVLRKRALALMCSLSERPSFADLLRDEGGLRAAVMSGCFRETSELVSRLAYHDPRPAARQIWTAIAGMSAGECNEQMARQMWDAADAEENHALFVECDGVRQLLRFALLPSDSVCAFSLGILCKLARSETGFEAMLTLDLSPISDLLRSSHPTIRAAARGFTSSFLAALTAFSTWA